MSGSSRFFSSSRWALQCRAQVPSWLLHGFATCCWYATFHLNGGCGHSPADLTSAKANKLQRIAQSAPPLCASLDRQAHLEAEDCPFHSEIEVRNRSRPVRPHFDLPYSVLQARSRPYQSFHSYYIPVLSWSSSRPSFAVQEPSLA